MSRPTLRSVCFGLSLALLLALAAQGLRTSRGSQAETSAALAQRSAQGSIARQQLPQVAPAALPAPLLYGTVRSAGGDAIAQAQVCASCVYPECGGLGPPSTRCVSSDERGAYAWRALEPGSYRFAVSAAGFEPKPLRTGDDDHTLIRAGTSLKRDVSLTPGGATLSGTVVDATGGPVPLALVQVLPSVEARGSAREQSEAGQLGVNVRSDEEGRFALSLRAGPVTLRAEADGYASVVRACEAPDSNVELRMVPAASLTGVVVSALDGRPLAQVEVTAYKHTPLVLSPGDGRALSAADGSFAIHGLSDGAFRVAAHSARWSGAAAQPVVLALSEAGGPVRIEARPAVNVTGAVQVAGADGACPAGNVFLGSSDPGEPDSFATVAAIENKGEFRLEGIPAGTYQLRVDCKDHLGRDYPTLRVQEKDLTGLRLEVDRGLSLRGQIVDAAGRGLPDRTISVMPSESSDDQALPTTSGQDRSDQDGMFRVHGLAPGVYQVSSGESHTSARRVELALGRAPVDVKLVVSAASKLRIRVEGVKGRASTTLSVYASSAAGELRAERARDGSYLLRDLNAGPYKVWASDGKGPAVSREVQVPDGQEVEVRLAIQAQREVLRGRVVDPRGNPVSDAWVRASRSTVTSLYEAAASDPVLTDVDGNFELTELARNEAYDVEAYLTHETKSVSRGLRAGQTVTLLLETNSKTHTKESL